MRYTPRSGGLRVRANGEWFRAEEALVSLVAWLIEREPAHPRVDPDWDRPLRRAGLDEVVSEECMQDDRLLGRLVGYLGCGGMSSMSTQSWVSELGYRFLPAPGPDEIDAAFDAAFERLAVWPPALVVVRRCDQHPPNWRVEVKPA